MDLTWKHEYKNKTIHVKYKEKTKLLTLKK